MKILFLVKFYQPFDRGGSEWSTHDLARLLVKKGHQVTILTPNYGAKKKEIIEGIAIYRMPFFKKLKDPKDQLTPWWTNNIFWFILSSLFCFWFVRRQKFDIIHIHSNEFVPAGVISSILSGKPTVATFRDYQIICNLGFCLWKSVKACNWRQYLKNDFSFFYKNYVINKNSHKFLLLFAAAVRARIFQKFLYFFAQKVDYKIAVSKKVADIFKANGLSNLQVIHNVVDIKLKPSAKSSNQIIYVGRLSKGKGVDLICECLPEIFEKIPHAFLKIIGSGYLAPILTETIEKHNLKSKVVSSGQLPHDAVLKLLRDAGLVIVPSLWPEPLPRAAIEAIVLGIPVVATNVGGITEVVKDNLYGILAEPTKESLKSAVINGFYQKDQFKKNILRDLAKIRKHFSIDCILAYEKIYQSARTL